MAPYNLPPGGMPYHYWVPPPPPPYYGHYLQASYGTPHSEPRTSAQTPRTWESNPSSDLEEIEDPMLFPHVKEWVAKLKQGPLGQDGHVRATLAGCGDHTTTQLTGGNPKGKSKEKSLRTPNVTEPVLYYALQSGTTLGTHHQPCISLTLD
ncbi:hypothetical protein JB92DRAFT_3132955 [Gautieria morchelliformis]|nr:hypothetical protein JB92DRAFT_3132955 [Gautieria morchelliformis]